MRSGSRARAHFRYASRLGAEMFRLNVHERYEPGVPSAMYLHDVIDLNLKQTASAYSCSQPQIVEFLLW